MRQPIKLLPYFENTARGGVNIARFKGLTVNCNAIGKSWELSAVPGKQSIVADGENAGMELQSLVECRKGDLVGEGVYSLYGGMFPLSLKLIDNSKNLMVEIDDCAGDEQTAFVCSADKICSDHGGCSDCLVDGPCFSVRKEDVEGKRTIGNPYDSFMGVMCVDGEGRLEVDGVSTPLKKGETLLLPSLVDEFDVQGSIKLLTVVSLIPQMLSSE